MAPAINTSSALRRNPSLALLPRPVSPERPTPHLDPDQYVRLLALVDRNGIVTLDEISRALPAVERPISAIVDLCDAGILGVDLAAFFDGDTTVWRLDR